ncbi:MAG: hypothetical protein K9J37_14960 [Saprospiraceae bacterium]|nr:hypothetical protein [Saprospiraceae bacterium]MCF8251209.1 hypothetical protein [Saprospiraceae bacterium]MCF8281193.1 hypothetical protein [Bacteroidales bacterium]MCF8313167.1 hypothetical protein [Saprospiraceae bacterium]MCF8441571.1 hypothetical protein [Saprospiraceae bacterium]
MVLRQVFDVINNQVVITLPTEFRGKKKVWVTVDDQVELHLKKMELMRMAASDPLFLADIKEVEEDFSLTDNEQL